MDWKDMTWEQKVAWVYAECPDPITTSGIGGEIIFHLEVSAIKDKPLTKLLKEMEEEDADLQS